MAMSQDPSNQRCHTLWTKAISKEMAEMEKLGVLQFYLPKIRFEKKYGLQYAPMHMIFELKQRDLRHEDRVVVGRHVVDSKEHNTYSSTIKYFYMKTMLLISVKNR